MSSDAEKQSPLYTEPQFIFGMIIVIAWLFFLYGPLSQVNTYEKDSKLPDPLASAERISALFTAALGFVLGHYFGKSGAEKGAQAATKSVKQDVKDGANQQIKDIKNFVAGLPT
jgi:hypothetical protein